MEKVDDMRKKKCSERPQIVVFLLRLDWLVNEQRKLIYIRASKHSGGEVESSFAVSAVNFGVPNLPKYLVDQCFKGSA